MSYTIALDDRRDRKVAIVGCGGTGGFVAEGLCRLLDPSEDILLIDHDRVEPHNILRQNFYAGDVGKFKSQVLAERLSRMYGRSIAYSVFPYDRQLLTESALGGYARSMHSGVIIGCVDNPVARRSLAELQWGDWWIDAGNGFHSGQVLIGNITKKELLTESFDEKLQCVHRLPAPSLQLPSLLAPLSRPEPRRDCAEAVAQGQSPVINQAMATLVLDFVYKLSRGELGWMGAYLDLESGTLSTVPAEPITVARMMSIKVEELMVHHKEVGVRQRIRV